MNCVKKWVIILYIISFISAEKSTEVMKIIKDMEYCMKNHAKKVMEQRKHFRNSQYHYAKESEHRVMLMLCAKLVSLGTEALPFIVQAQQNTPIIPAKYFSTVWESMDASIIPQLQNIFLQNSHPNVKFSIFTALKKKQGIVPKKLWLHAFQQCNNKDLSLFILQNLAEVNVFALSYTHITNLFQCSPHFEIRKICLNVLQSNKRVPHTFYINALNDPHSKVASRAAQVIGNLKISTAVDQLKQKLYEKDENVRSDASRALAQIGEKGLTILGEALFAQDPKIRFWAVANIDNAEGAKKYLPHIKKMIHDKDPMVRKMVPYAVVNIVPQNATPFLLKILPKADAFTRESIAVSLGRVKNHQQQAFKALVYLLGDDQGHVRRYAAIALKNLNYPGTVQILRKMKEDNSDLRTALERALRLWEK